GDTVDISVQQKQTCSCVPSMPPYRHSPINTSELLKASHSERVGWTKGCLSLGEKILTTSSCTLVPFITFFFPWALSATASKLQQY
ncbi:hypothetical protein AMECASPLE_007769, partial [Ameca splendens]